MKRVVIAGVSCGCASMERAAEAIREACNKKDINAKVLVHNLLLSSQIDPRADLVIQMIPYFNKLECPLINGRSLVNYSGEEFLVEQVTNVLSQDD